MNDFKRELACTQKYCVFGAGFWHPAHTKQHLSPGMVQQLLSGSLPGLTVSARIQPCRMHTKANRSSGSINTNICDNIQISSQKALFFNHFFFLSYYLYVFVFHSRNSRGFAVSSQLLGLAWHLHKGECHSVSCHQDLQEGRAISHVRWHVGNRRTDQLHHAVSAC